MLLWTIHTLRTIMFCQIWEPCNMQLLQQPRIYRYPFETGITSCNYHRNCEHHPMCVLEEWLDIFNMCLVHLESPIDDHGFNHLSICTTLRFQVGNSSCRLVEELVVWLVREILTEMVVVMMMMMMMVVTEMVVVVLMIVVRSLVYLTGTFPPDWFGQFFIHTHISDQTHERNLLAAVRCFWAASPMLVKRRNQVNDVNV